MAYLHIIPLIGSSFITNFMHFCEKNEITCINVSSISIKKKWKYYASRHTSTQFRNYLLRRGFCFFLNCGKEGKVEKRERRKTGKGGKSAREREKRRKPCKISVEIWQKLSISDCTQPECRLSFS